MNLKAAELNMSSTLYTHPAGGCITTPQDQVNLWLEGWQHPLFRQISTDRYYTGPHTCGEDADGAAKCFFGVEKLGHQRLEIVAVGAQAMQPQHRGVGRGPGFDLDGLERCRHAGRGRCADFGRNAFTTASSVSM
jgi:hypothetical protein